MESLIENYLGGRHTLMYMNMTLGMYHPCKGVAREAGNDVVCYCSQQRGDKLVCCMQNLHHCGSGVAFRLSCCDVLGHVKDHLE